MAMPTVPQLPAAERVRMAYQDRNNSDYIANFWTAVGWSILTCGIYSFYMFFLGVPILKKCPKDKAAVYTIVVVLTGKEPPLAGPPSVRMIVAPGQLSFTPGSVQETFAAHWPGAASA